MWPARVGPVGGLKSGRLCRLSGLSHYFLTIGLPLHDSEGLEEGTNDHFLPLKLQGFSVFSIQASRETRHELYLKKKSLVHLKKSLSPQAVDVQSLTRFSKVRTFESARRLKSLSFEGKRFTSYITCHEWPEIKRTRGITYFIAGWKKSSNQNIYEPGLFVRKKGHNVPLSEIDKALQVQEKPLSEAMRYSPSIDQQSLLCGELKITPIAPFDHASTTYSPSHLHLRFKLSILLSPDAKFAGEY
ncbi:unnamed protein product [Brassica rapa subsp. narinosa]